MMRLFELGKIGKMTVKNRVVMAPMFCMGMTSPTEQRGFSQRGVDYYATRAQGGVGLIITGVTAPNDKFEASWGWPLINNKEAIMWLNETAEAVHDHGAKIAIQYSAGFGRQSEPDPNLPHGGLVAPSPVSSFFDPAVTCRELKLDEIEQFVKDFEQGAMFIREGGIDAIEIHAHQGYLLDQFITARTNWRTDKYGGSFDNRIRILIDCFHAVKRGAGVDFPVIFRYGLSHQFSPKENVEDEGARDVEEGLKIALKLEAEGFDALHIDAGVYETNNWAQPPQTMPEGCLVHLAELTKNEVKIPVIAVGRLGYPQEAEKTLQEGKADFVALGRPLLADPEWPNKVKEGRFEDIRPCLAEHEGCLARLVSHKYLSCTVNPQTGNERNLALTPATKQKKVVVVGGGPGGMEAARVSALRGHKVTLVEKNHELGGNLLTAGAPPFKVEYIRYRDYLATQLRKLDVTTRLNTEATTEVVLSMNPDVVFIATGAKAFLPDIPGINRKEVITAVELLLKKPEIGNKVVIIGGGMVGAETALYLARQGKNVTIVEILDEIMRDSFWVNNMDMQRRFAGLEEEQLAVEVFLNTKPVEVVDGGIVVDKEGKISNLEADVVIIAVGMKPRENWLASTLEGKAREVYSIGDCVKAGHVKDAVWGGFRIARNV